MHHVLKIVKDIALFVDKIPYVRESNDDYFKTFRKDIFLYIEKLDDLAKENSAMQQILRKIRDLKNVTIDHHCSRLTSLIDTGKYNHCLGDKYEALLKELKNREDSLIRKIDSIKKDLTIFLKKNTNIPLYCKGTVGEIFNRLILIEKNIRKKKHFLLQRIFIEPAILCNAEVDFCPQKILLVFMHDKKGGYCNGLAKAWLKNNGKLDCGSLPDFALTEQAKTDRVPITLNRIDEYFGLRILKLLKEKQKSILISVRSRYLTFESGHALAAQKEQDIIKFYDPNIGTFSFYSEDYFLLWFQFYTIYLLHDFCFFTITDSNEQLLPLLKIDKTKADRRLQKLHLPQNKRIWAIRFQKKFLINLNKKNRGEILKNSNIFLPYLYWYKQINPFNKEIIARIKNLESYLQRLNKTRTFARRPPF